MTAQEDVFARQRTRQYNRRQILQSGAGLGAAALGAAVTSGRRTAAAGVTLKILVPQGALADGLTKTAPSFEQQTGNKIQVSAFPYTDLQAKVFTLTKVKSNEFDMYFIDDPWMPNIKPDQNAVAIDKEYGYKRDPDVFPVCYDVFTWPPPYGPVPKSVRDQDLPQHLYGLPIVGNVILFTIRHDILDQQHIPLPATWDDTVAIAKKENDPTKPFYGWDMRAASGSTIDTIPILWTYGGDIFDDNFNVVLDNEAGLAAFRVIADLAKNTPPGVLTYDTNEFADEFLAGRAMMGMTWPGDELVAMEDPKQSKSAGKLTYMNPPAAKAGAKGASMLGNWGLILNKYSQHRDQAYQFMDWITAADHSLEYAKNGGIPFRKSNLNNPELVAKFPWYPAQAQAMAAPPKWRPRATFGVQVLQQFYGPDVALMVGGKLTPEQALKKTASDIRDFMKTVAQ